MDPGDALVFNYCLIAVNSPTLALDTLCPGQLTVVTCNITRTGAAQLNWVYTDSQGITQTIATTLLPPTVPVLIDGLEFTVTTLASSPHLVSQISFVATSGTGQLGRTLSCNDGSKSFSNIILQIANIAIGESACLCHSYNVILWIL